MTTDKLRIGSFAELTGTTPRTIRYYEEIGLLPCPSPRDQGQHRCYSQADVERVKEIVRLRDLLGVSLEQLARLLAADGPPAELLALVRARRRELSELERELIDRGGIDPASRAGRGAGVDPYRAGRGAGVDPYRAGRGAGE